MSHSCWLRPVDDHDDVIKWKHFSHYWPFVREIHRSLVNSPHKGQWRGALMFSLICAWINSWAKNREANDLRRHRAHYDLIVLYLGGFCNELEDPTIIVLACEKWYVPRSLSILFAVTFTAGRVRNCISHRGPVNSPHKWPVTWKMFPFDDVIMV